MYKIRTIKPCSIIITIFFLINTITIISAVNNRFEIEQTIPINFENRDGIQIDETGASTVVYWAIWYGQLSISQEKKLTLSLNISSLSLNPLQNQIAFLLYEVSCEEEAVNHHISTLDSLNYSKTLIREIIFTNDKRVLFTF